jgi:hypothetical protein
MHPDYWETRGGRMRADGINRPVAQTGGSEKTEKYATPFFYTDANVNDYLKVKTC